MAICLGLIGTASLQQGDLTTARSFAEQSLRLSKEIEFLGSTADALTLLGKVNVVQGDYTAARALYEESLASPFGVNLWSLEELASVVAVQGDPTWAAQLWGAAEALRESLGTPMPPVDRPDYERSVAATRAQLGMEAFVAAWEEGRAMTAEQALAAQGRTTVPTATPNPLDAISAPPAKSLTTYPAGLTAREVEVLRLIAQGLTNEQVAEQLVISPRTVNTCLTAIYGKIGVSSRSAATRYAIEHHLI
jgi:ATP/maltotriose-dependent transcriptional regulator MalT